MRGAPQYFKEQLEKCLIKALSVFFKRYSDGITSSQSNFQPNGHQTFYKGLKALLPSMKTLNFPKDFFVANGKPLRTGLLERNKLSLNKKVPFCLHIWMSR